MFRIVDQEIEDEERQKKGLAPRTEQEKKFTIKLVELVQNEEAQGQDQQEEVGINIVRQKIDWKDAGEDQKYDQTNLPVDVQRHDQMEQPNHIPAGNMGP